MGARSSSAGAVLKRAGRTSLARLGAEERAAGVLGRLRAARRALGEEPEREPVAERTLHVALAAILRPDSSAIDVGANVGAVLESIVRIAPQGRHMAFEPLPGLCAALAERFPGVEVEQVALSDAAGTAEFTHVLDAPAYSGLRQRADLPQGLEQVQRIQVRTARLDDVLPEDRAPALIKIDVEGAELQVLQGAIETLRRHRPFVVFEHGSGGADLYGTRPEQVFDLLTEVGLRIFDMDGGGPYTRERFQETFTEPIWNFLATPA